MDKQEDLRYDPPMPIVNTRRQPPHGFEYWTSDTGQLMLVHAKDRCSGHCAIHAPSDHPMKDWRRHWRDDRKIMERLCPEHGVGHPDFDTMRYLESQMGKERASYEGVHGCCGCEIP